MGKGFIFFSFFSQSAHRSPSGYKSSHRKWIQFILNWLLSILRCPPPADTCRLIADRYLTIANRYMS